MSYQSIVGTLAIIVVMCAVVALLGALAILVLRWVRKQQPAPFLLKVISVLAGLVGAAGSLAVAGSGAKLELPDQGRQAILDFYKQLENKNWSTAWSYIHPARKDEVLKRGMQNADDLKKAYVTTRVYRNVQVVFDAHEQATSRYYVSDQ